MSENRDEAYTNNAVHNTFNTTKTKYLSSKREAKYTEMRRDNLLKMNKTLRNDIKHLNEHGYIVLRNLITNPDILSKVYNESKSLLNDIPFGRNKFEGYKTKRCHNVLSKSRIYDQFILHKRCTNILDYYLSPNHLLSIIQLIDIYPGSNAQPLHYDSQSLYGITRPRIDRPMQVSFFWCIDNNYKRDNGATVLIPKSHLWDANKEPTNNDYNNGISFDLNPGDCICILGTLWHGGGKHNGIFNDSRMILTSQHCQPYIRPIEGIMLSVPFKKVLELPPKLQTMIGYSIHFPFYGSVNGIHPLKYLKNNILKQSKL